MKFKYLYLTAISSLSVLGSFGQDSSKLPLNHKLNTVNSTTGVVSDSVTSAGNQNPDKPHATITTNSGIAAPATTSGSLNSTVNPNTQFTIPFGKSKRKHITHSSTASPASTEKK